MIRASPARAEGDGRPESLLPSLDQTDRGPIAVMNVAIAFGADRLEFEVPDDRLVGAWAGPPPLDPEALAAATAAGFESPPDYPALRLAVVPGDRVVLALDPATPGLVAILPVLFAILREAGVADDAIRIVAPTPAPTGLALTLPSAVTWTVHDPEDRAELAYLASLESERRVYLNRHLIDADVVLPIAPIGYDSTLGIGGPWGQIFPTLSDTETRQAFADLAGKGRHDPDAPRPALSESLAVSRLLGAQLQCAVLPGAGGPAALLVGEVDGLTDRASEALETGWTAHVDRPADLVVLGLGEPDRPVAFATLGAALASAGRLVNRGGRIAVLSNLADEPGPAVRRLLGLDDPGEARAALKGAEGEPDYRAARLLAGALGRAKVYLYSGLDESLVEDLGLIALGEAREARRLVDGAESCLFLSQAERFHIRLDDESEAG